jgi:hypothetical protein
MPPLAVEIVFVEEFFFDAQTEVRKFDQSRVITESDPIEVSDAILFAMNSDQPKAVCRVACKSAMVESPLTSRRLQIIGLIPSKTTLS